MLGRRAPLPPVLRRASQDANNGIETALGIRVRNRITMEERMKVIELERTGLSYHTIGKNVGISYNSARRICHDHEHFNRISIATSGSSVPPIELMLIEHLIKERDGKITRHRLATCLSTVFKKQYTIDMIAHRLSLLGARVLSSRKVQLIRPRNRIHRMQFGNFIENGLSESEYYCFVDETNVSLQNLFHDKYNLPNFKPSANSSVKHPLHVHVFAGISKRGPTDVVVWVSSRNKSGTVGTLDGPMYAEVMVKGVLKSFNQKAFDGKMILIQDNSPVHKCKVVKQALLDSGIQIGYFPAESPDYNPIEFVWRDLKNFLQSESVTNIDSLTQRIILFFQRVVTPAYCQHLIAHSRKVLFRSQNGLNGEHGGLAVYHG